MSKDIPAWLKERLDDVTVGGQTSAQIEAELAAQREREHAVEETHSYLEAEQREYAGDA